MMKSGGLQLITRITAREAWNSSTTLGGAQMVSCAVRYIRSNMHGLMGAFLASCR